MHTYQYIIMLVLLIYCVKASSKGAFILLAAHTINFAIVVYDIPAEAYIYYYSCAAFVQLIVGIVLQKEYRVASLCGYSLVFVNIYGAYAWYTYQPENIYDNICLVILITQLLSIITRGLLNGLKLHGFYRKHPVVSPTRFDSFQSRGTMCKIKTSQEVKECAKRQSR